MTLPAPCALLRGRHAEIINLRCRVGYKYWLKFRLHVITDERISRKCAPFFLPSSVSFSLEREIFGVCNAACLCWHSSNELLFPVIYLPLAPTYIFFPFHLFIVFLFSLFQLHFTRSHFILYTFTSAIRMCPVQLSQFSEYNTSWMIGKSEFDFLPKQRYFGAPQPDYLWVPPSLLSNRFRVIFPWI